MIKKILLGLLVGLVAIQFIRPARNVSTGLGPEDISAKHPVPAPVQGLLQRACYDCHSNNTHYPWYAEVQPLGWWLTKHVNDGKRHLDFSAFGTYTPKRAGKKLAEIADEVEHREMPLKSYTWMHPEARLTAAEIKLLVDWVEALKDEIPPP
jgi:hypothetical protein